MLNLRCMGLALLCVAGGAAHATEYWAALGSFRDVDGAETMLQQAQGRLPEAFSVVPGDTPSGRYYRVVTGPYQTRALARSAIDDAKAAGFYDAWLLATDDAVAPLSGYGGVGGLSDGLDLDLDVEALESNAATSEYTITPRERTDSERKPLPTLVDKAPSNYQLHRLRRVTSQ